MKLQDQVCSLELAKIIKELGVKQESNFFWVEFRNASASLGDNMNIVQSQICRIDQLLDYEDYKHIKDLKYYSAFTSAELGEILPKERFPIWDYREKCWVVLDGSKWKTEADSRAKMLIYLLEKKLIKQQSFITKEISRDKLYDDLCSVYSLSICDRNAVMSQVDILIEQERLKQNACRNKS